MDLWCYIWRGPANSRVELIFPLVAEECSQPEVRNFEITMAIQKDVFRLDVWNFPKIVYKCQCKLIKASSELDFQISCTSVCYTLSMYVRHPRNKLGEVKMADILRNPDIRFLEALNPSVKL